MLLSSSMGSSEEDLDARDTGVNEDLPLCGSSRFRRAGIRYHSKSRTGCITCKTRRIKCDETKPTCDRCKKAGYECEGYARCSSGKCKEVSQRPHTKSKSGCLTCKARRVKCDETMPACGRCTKSGLNCGYAPLKSGSNGPHEVEIVQSDISGNQGIFHLPLNRLSGSQQDKRSFAFFYSETAPLLAGCFDAGFWTQILVQISCAEVTVWHSILSMSTLHECYGLGGNNPRGEKTPMMRAFALQHYNKAIGLLTGGMSGNKPQTDTLLIGCLIFIMIEMLLQNSHQALLHLYNGIQIIRDWRKSKMLTDSPNRSQLINTYLTPIFDDFSMHLNVFGDSTPLNAAHTGGRLTFRADHCTNLFDSRDSLLNLAGEALEFAMGWKNSNYERDSPETVVALMQKSDLTSRDQTWLQSFEHFLSQPEMEVVREEEECGILLLRLVHKILSICIANSMRSDEMSFDNYVDIYEESVCLAEAACSKMFESESTVRRTSFFLQMQHISPLYITATKCRNPAIRRRALNVMKRSQGGKGFWDAGLANKLVEKVIAIEEEGLEHITDATGMIVPSDWSRIYEIVINPGPRKLSGDDPRTLVTFKQKSRKNDGKWILRQEYVDL